MGGEAIIISELQINRLMIDSGFIFQNPHRRVAVPDVPMLVKAPMFPMSDVHIGRTLLYSCTVMATVDVKGLKWTKQ